MIYDAKESDCLLLLSMEDSLDSIDVGFVIGSGKMRYKIKII